MPKLPDLCPLCQSELIITRYYCPGCESHTEGYFQRPQDPFAKLNKEQLDFLLTFVRLEGRLNRMEESLGISYPTLKSRLTDVIHALGFEAEKPPVSNGVDRQQILEDLENGLIDANEALSLLQPSAKAS